MGALLVSLAAFWWLLVLFNGLSCLLVDVYCFLLITFRPNGIFVFSKNPKKQKISTTFHCSLSLVGYEKNQVVTGTVVGSIISSKRGNDGFGYDPFFIPQNSNKTFAEMGLKEKMFLSHRFEAFKILSINQK